LRNSNVLHTSRNQFSRNLTSYPKRKNTSAIKLRIRKKSQKFGRETNSKWEKEDGKINIMKQGAGKSLARPGRKHATATEDFEFHVPYL